MNSKEKLFLGELVINSLKIFGLFNTTVKICFFTKAIPAYYLGILQAPKSTSEYNLQNQYTFQFLVELRNCELGEIVKAEIRS